MALKRKITATEHAALSDVLKAEYKADGAGFVLDTDDATELKNARDAEKEARKTAETKLREAQEALDALKDDTSRKNGDVAALEASWTAKHAAEKKRADDAEKALNGERQDRHASTVATKIAARFTVPGLVMPQIAKRLAVEMHDGTAVVRVLDKDGKPSALSTADLEKEFVDNAEYKAIVIASKATGSADQRLGPGAVPLTPQLQLDQSGKPKPFATLGPKELAAHMKATDPNQGEA